MPQENTYIVYETDRRLSCTLHFQAFFREGDPAPVEARAHFLALGDLDHGSRAAGEVRGIQDDEEGLVALGVCVAEESRKRTQKAEQGMASVPAPKPSLSSFSQSFARVFRHSSGPLTSQSE